MPNYANYCTQLHQSENRPSWDNIFLLVIYYKREKSFNVGMITGLTNRVLSNDPKLGDGPSNDPKLGDGPSSDPKLGNGPINDTKLGDGPSNDPKLEYGPSNVPKLEG